MDSKTKGISQEERNKLEPFSQRYVEFLSSRRPEWLNFAGIEDIYNRGIFTLLIEFPCPSDPKSSLAISTEDEEITINWSFYHNHIDGNTDEESFENSLRTFDDLTAEKVKLVYWTRKGKWIGSSYIAPQEKAENHVSFLKSVPDLVTEKSWEGTYNSRTKLRKDVSLWESLVGLFRSWKR